jgi:uncharacterized membrane protein AbrB (regulator of aidB expression)
MKKTLLFIAFMLIGWAIASKFDTDTRELESQPYHSHQIQD